MGIESGNQPRCNSADRTGPAASAALRRGAGRAARRAWLLAAAVLAVACGCKLTRDKPNFYGQGEEDHYRTVAGQIEYPDVAPAAVRTIQEPALVDTDPRFGVEAALSAFDARFSTGAVFEKNDRALNNAFFGGGTRLLSQDLIVLGSEVQKRAATGTLFSFRHNTDYDANNAPGNAFPSAWNTNFEAEFRHPLLRGAGVEYNRIAGPHGQPGIFYGVLLARVNTDVSLADFEAGVRGMVADVENAYWDLYFAYRDLDAKIAARNSALETWRQVNARFAVGRRGGEAEKEAQAREQFFRFQAEVENALCGQLLDGTRTNNGSSGGTMRGTGGVHLSERRLRLMIGLPASDGRLIRPADEPLLPRIVFDWQEIAGESLVRRPELRRQRWLVKRRELELTASRNFLLARLDTVGRYRWRGFGHDLLNSDGRVDERFDNAWENLMTGDFQEWQLGVEMEIPIGYRQAHAAVRNAELQLARERSLLDEQQRQVVSDLSNALADQDRAYVVAQTNFNRRLAARQQVAAVQAAYDADQAPLDLLLEAQRRLAEAETNYYRSLVEYTLAVRNVHFEKGSSLDYNEIFLAEGPWPGKAYQDALRRQDARINYALARPARPISQGAVPQGLLPAPQPLADAAPPAAGAEPQGAPVGPRPTAP